ILTDARDHRRAGNEHRRGPGHHRVVAGGKARRAEAGDRTEAERHHRHRREVRTGVVEAHGGAAPAPPGGAPRGLDGPGPAPPPDPSMMRMMGRRTPAAIISAISGFSRIVASADPPRTVKSSPTTTTGRPSIRARPKTQLDGVSCSSSFPAS